MPPTTVLDQKGIWIASYPKSGNTWVRIFIHNLLRELNGDSGEAQDINALNQHTTWELKSADYEKHFGKPISEATPIEIAKARYDVQREMADKRAEPFFIKTHNSVANVEGYPTINIDITLAAIYILRNPLDLAISYSHHCNMPLDSTIAYMAHPNATSQNTKRAVYEFVDSWSEHVASWVSIPIRPVHVIRYEDMVNSPERVFAGLATFLRVKPTKQQLLNAIEKSSFKVLVAQEAEKGFRERPPKAEKFFREGRIGQWKEVLSKAQIRAIVDAHAPMMQRFGYLVPDCGRVIWRPETS